MNLAVPRARRVSAPEAVEHLGAAARAGRAAAVAWSPRTARARATSSLHPDEVAGGPVRRGSARRVAAVDVECLQQGRVPRRVAQTDAVIAQVRRRRALHAGPRASPRSRRRPANRSARPRPAGTRATGRAGAARHDRHRRHNRNRKAARRGVTRHRPAARSGSSYRVGAPARRPVRRTSGCRCGLLERLAGERPLVLERGGVELAVAGLARTRACIRSVQRADLTHLVGKDVAGAAGIRSTCAGAAPRMAVCLGDAVTVVFCRCDAAPSSRQRSSIRS